MSDSAETPVSPDDVERRRSRIYRAANRDPQWAIAHLLTEAIGTLRSLTMPFHTGEQAAKRAAEALAEIDAMVDRKLGGDDAQR
jgi:hypothetical protein